MDMDMRWETLFYRSLDNLLRDIFREDDIVGRIGGDEFVVVMKNIKMKEMAIAKAEELLTKTQQYEIKELNGSAISISIGIAGARRWRMLYGSLQTGGSSLVSGKTKWKSKSLWLLIKITR